MGTVVSKFVYSDIEDALYYSGYYGDLLTSYGNDFDSTISFDGECYTLAFRIYDAGRKNNSGNSKRTRRSSKSSPKDSQNSV